MAQVIGNVRPDRATAGERLVLKKLQTSLPKEFIVYVEYPLRGGKRSLGRGEIERYPDFIVLANYGVVVLEVKDWIQIEKADKKSAVIRMRNGKVRSFGNPVQAARGYAHLLNEALQDIPGLVGDKGRVNIPWGYAAVLPNLPMSVITQLRGAWGESFVLGTADLESGVATKRLRATLPRNHMLTKRELYLVRGVINPEIFIESPEPEGNAIILDTEQERLISEPVSIQSTSEAVPDLKHQQITLDQDLQPEEAEVQASSLLPIEEAIVQNPSIRLVRGVAGSGKSLVLIRRARYLKAQFPEWNIGVLSFNKRLADSMQTQFRGTGIEASTFHKLCRGLLVESGKWKEPYKSTRSWLKEQRHQNPGIERLGIEFIEHEIKWIKDVGITDVDRYLGAPRKGRGTGLTRDRRREAFEVFTAYQDWLATEGTFDWDDIPRMVLREIEAGHIQTGTFDALLIDEAQDFAPTWLAVLARMVKPSTGVLFLADDPAQSIYRHFSWKEKGVSVVGRTRWLRIPYRNTREIHTAAYAVIENDKVLTSGLEDQVGLILQPELVEEHMRSGPRPELRKFSNFDDEATFLQAEIRGLLQDGFHANQIAVLARRRSGVLRLSRVLKGLDVEVATFHAFKGLEHDVVFLSQLDKCSNGHSHTEEELSEERRLVYMAMTRARERLYLNACGNWPPILEPAFAFADRVGAA